MSIEFDKENIKIGWRTIKTVIAVTVTSLIINFMRDGSAVLGNLAAVFALRSSNEDTLKYSLFRIAGNSIGIFIAVIITLFSVQIGLYDNPIYMSFATGFGVFLVIIACNTFGLKHSIVAASAGFLVVFLSITPDDAITYGFSRLIDTMIGSAVAISINYIFPNRMNPDEFHMIHIPHRNETVD